MDIDNTFKSIRALHQTVSGKSDSDVILTFKGPGYGVTKPWHARVDNRECNHESWDGALGQLLEMLRKELADKVKNAEVEATRLRQALNQLGN